MIDGLFALGRAMGNLRDMGYTYIWANVAFVALSLPIITMPAAFSALFRVGHAAYTEPSEADLSLFWETFRQNLWRAFPWGVVNIAFIVINTSNLIAYSGIQEPLYLVLRAIWAASVPIWLALLLYTWPIYYEMENPSIIGAVRNAGVMLLINPIFTFVILTGVALVVILSTLFVAAWILLTCGVIAAIANAAVLDRLQLAREQGGN